jgi:hypothetical protein
VAELEAVAKERCGADGGGRVERGSEPPGVATVIVGATKTSQLEGNIQALSFTIPQELLRRLVNQRSDLTVGRGLLRMRPVRFRAFRPISIDFLVPSGAPWLGPRRASLRR